MPPETTIDFITIGIGKGGTKSLYAHLQAHPQVYLPYAYEIGFFCLDDLYAKGVDWYLGEYFPEVPKDAVAGEISPQYMARLCSADRIHQHFPDARIVAILRNPVDRAYSAYRMMVRRTMEKRSFEEALAEQEREVARRDPLIDPGEILGHFEYLRAGYYAHILDHYLRLFPREHIKILFTEELQRAPTDTMQSLYRFLGVDDAFVPPEPDKRHHEGGDARFPFVNALLESRLYRALARPIKPLLPKNMRWFAYRVYNWNVKPSQDTGLSPAQRERIAVYFKEDVDRLAETFHVTPPWPEFAHAGSISS